MKESKLYWKQRQRLHDSVRYTVRLRHALREIGQAQGIEELTGILAVGIAAEKRPLNNGKAKKETYKTKLQSPLRLFWGLFGLGVLLALGLFWVAAAGLLGPMPDLKQLENPKTNLATQVISSDGVVLGKYYYNDNRTPITYDELPQNLVDALIATEDERFYEHSGIDWRGTLRALVYLGKKEGPAPSPSSWPASCLLGFAPETYKRPYSKK